MSHETIRGNNFMDVTTNLCKCFPLNEKQETRFGRKNVGKYISSPEFLMIE